MCGSLLERPDMRDLSLGPSVALGDRYGHFPHVISEVQSSGPFPGHVMVSGEVKAPQTTWRQLWKAQHAHREEGTPFPIALLWLQRTQDLIIKVPF